MEDYLKIDEEIQLFYRINLAKKPKANIIITHGFAEHLGRYNYVTKKLNEANFNVLRYDVRGHGKSKGKKGYVDNYNNFINDLDKMVDKINKEAYGLPLFMLGHSMGGLITTLYGLRHPKKVKGQILSGAANGELKQAEGLRSNFLNFAASVLPNLYIKNPVEEKICSVDSVVSRYKNDPLVLKKASVNLFNEFLNKASKEVLNNLSKYKLPVLILHGEDDDIVDKSISENFYENISSENKELIIYKDLYHEILNEKNRDEILEKIIKWVKDQILAVK